MSYVVTIFTEKHLYRVKEQNIPLDLVKKMHFRCQSLA